jgi:thiol-disulfide isomerase/thioredoxin
VVIVDFWATWCAPCKQELPLLEKLYQKYKGRGLMIVGVSVDQEAANVGAFVKQLKLTFPIVHDKAHSVADRVKPPKMPSSYVVDRNGVVRHLHGGFRSGDEGKIESEINALLGQ